MHVRIRRQTPKACRRGRETESELLGQQTTPAAGVVYVTTSPRGRAAERCTAVLLLLLLLLGGAYRREVGSAGQRAAIDGNDSTGHGPTYRCGHALGQACPSVLDEGAAAHGATTAATTVEHARPTHGRSLTDLAPPSPVWA